MGRLFGRGDKKGKEDEHDEISEEERKVTRTTRLHAAACLFFC